MSVSETAQRPNLVARARGILFQPTAEWARIRDEPTTIAQLFTGYACVIFAIPSLAVLLQLVLFTHLGWLPAIIVAVVGYGLSLLGVLIAGAIFNALAPGFGGQRSFVQAMKLAVYPQTAACVAGVLNIVPALGIVASLAGLYGLYILWVGLPRLMKVPHDKAVGYVVVSAILAFIVNIVLVVLVAVISREIVVAVAR